MPAARAWRARDRLIGMPARPVYCLLGTAAGAVWVCGKRSTSADCVVYARGPTIRSLRVPIRSQECPGVSNKVSSSCGLVALHMKTTPRGLGTKKNPKNATFWILCLVLYNLEDRMLCRLATAEMATFVPKRGVRLAAQH